MAILSSPSMFYSQAEFLRRQEALIKRRQISVEKQVSTYSLLVLRIGP